MTKTVLITGSSTGIGKAAVDYFVSKGWNVAATMRTPEKAQDFVKADNLRLYALDVTDTSSIRKAIDQTIIDFGQIRIPMRRLYRRSQF